MKTNDLISMLAMGSNSESVVDSKKRFWAVISVGIFCASIMMLVFLHLNPDLMSAISSGKFWVKISFVFSIATISLHATIRLLRPGVKLTFQPFALATPVILIWILAVTVLLKADSPGREGLFFGTTWMVCPLLISLLSCPIFVAMIFAMKDAASTRLKLSGAIAGLFSGATGAVVYCFHCPEMEAPFIAFWYLVGISIPAFVGAIYGERLLRW